MINTNDPGVRRFTVWMAVALVVVIADQVTKLAIIEHIEHYAKVPLTSFINLTHQRNYGAAFSFLAGAGGWQRWFFTVVAVAVSAFILHWLYRLPREERVTALALSLILGGAIGNLIDRLYFGHVIDYIQVWFGSWPFPAFNIADASISIGAALLILSAFTSGRQAGGEDA